MDGLMDGWIKRWMDGRINGWMNGWMNLWMNGWPVASGIHFYSTRNSKLYRHIFSSNKHSAHLSYFKGLMFGTVSANNYLLYINACL